MAKKTVASTAPPPVVEPRRVDPGSAMVRSPDGKPFWERHPDHLKGEVWVAGSGNQPSAPVRVAMTDAVKRALREGRLERIAPQPPEGEEADGGERV